jgi:hypothetical protein
VKRKHAAVPATPRHFAAGADDFGVPRPQVLLQVSVVLL